MSNGDNEPCIIGILCELERRTNFGLAMGQLLLTVSVINLMFTRLGSVMDQVTEGLTLGKIQIYCLRFVTSWSLNLFVISDS